MCFNKKNSEVRYILRNQERGKDVPRQGKYNIVLWADKKKTRMGGLNREGNDEDG